MYLCGAVVYALPLFLFSALPSMLFIPVVDLFESFCRFANTVMGFSMDHHNMCPYPSFSYISLVTPFVV